MDKLSLEGLELQGSGIATSERISEQLERAQMFRDFDWSQIQSLAGYIQLYQAQPGTVLFQEGERGHFMCIVLEGKLEVRKENAKGDRRTVATVFPGRSLGEMAMVDGEPRSASAVIVTPSLLAVMTEENFKTLLQDKPALAARMLFKIAQLLSQRLRQTSGMLVDYLEG